MYEFNVDQFPIHGLPQSAQDVIREVAEARQAPRDCAAAGALIALSIAAGGFVKVASDFENMLNLYCAIVAPSGANKSTPVKDMLAPVRERDNALCALYEMECAAVDAQAKAAKGAKGAKGGAPAKEPPPKLCMLQDATAEARNTALAANPRGLLYYADELLTLMGNLNRYTKGGSDAAEKGALLQLYDGDGIKINRKGERMLRTKSAFLSIIGTTQPEILAKCFDAGTDLHNGLLPRFLFFMPSTLPVKDYATSRAPAAGIMGRFGALVSAMFQKYDEPVSIGVTPEARHALDLFRNATGNGYEGYEGTLMGKLHIAAYRLAGIAAAARAAEAGAAPIINKEDIQWAISCCLYFYKTGMKAAASVRGRPLGAEANRLTKKGIIGAVFDFYPDAKVGMFAKALDVTPAFVSKAKNEYKNKRRLTG